MSGESDVRPDVVEAIVAVLKGGDAGACPGGGTASSTVDARPLVWRHPVNLPRAGRQQG